MKSTKVAGSIQFGIRLTLMLIFSYSGFFKFQNFSEFRVGLLKTGIFSQMWLQISAFTMVAVEVLICILLLKWPKKGIWVSFIASIGFSVCITYLHQNSIYSECGCGGILNGLSYPGHLIFNLSMIIISAFYLLLDKNVKLSTL